ncbi:hypothetical protein OOZ19_03985 [Saccharopolyspora sp. NFXS83]|uniref:hypothetical protein n=1 Tax=Saccharopolyspora sp. NFXS83 TaxID=2993560 RepID=UPI00224AC29C|nr:hypothetical protein [Saccharopolyspora sp. NFXS83]MCX2729388.1 hypothetical protein [Saccharopolyspora sp. NFXS83]
MEGREHDVREGETTRWAMAASGHPQEEPPGIDDFMESPDFAMTEHLPVRCPPRASYAALRHLDLLTVRSPVIDAAMLVRGWPAWLRRHVPARTRTRRPRGRGELAPALRKTGSRARPGRRGQVLDAGPQPRIARACGRGSLLSYDVRVSLDDALSLRTFGWYWWTVGPFIRLIMRATLRRAASDALTGEDES